MSKTRHGAAFTPKAGSTRDRNDMRRQANFVAGAMVRAKPVPPIVQINQDIQTLDLDIESAKAQGFRTDVLEVRRERLVRMRDFLTN